MFFHPCWDVCQAAWDPCSYRWIIWSKWEIELCVISVEMVGEAMCLYDGTQWCSVCGEEEGSKNRFLRKPSDQLMCFGYLPSPGHLERPTSEIGFKPAKWNPSDVQWWEGGQEDLMIDSVQSSRQIQQNEDWWFGIGFCNSQIINHLSQLRFAEEHLWTHNTSNLEADGQLQQKTTLGVAPNRKLRLQFTHAHQN